MKRLICWLLGHPTKTEAGAMPRPSRMRVRVFCRCGKIDVFWSLFV